MTHLASGHRASVSVRSPTQGSDSKALRASGQQTCTAFSSCARTHSSQAGFVRSGDLVPVLAHALANPGTSGKAIIVCRAASSIQSCAEDQMR